MSEIAIETRKLTKIYNYGKEYEVHALNGIDLSIAKGELVALTGTSGSGKSTLLNIIGGLDSATCGEVWLFGKKISDMKDKELAVCRRRTIGFVYQKFCLLGELTVRENIIMPVLFDGKVVDNSYIEDVCRLLKIEGRLDYFAGQLSGGQQQRVAIARALANKADLLLCDEPTGNLDRKTSDEVMRLLVKIHNEFEKTVLIVTHDEKIASCAEKRLCIEDGRIL